MMNTFVIDERELVAEFRVNTQEQFLKYIEQYEAYIAPIMRANGYRRINQTERTVLFTFGEITFSRSRWTNGIRTRVPIDEKKAYPIFQRVALLCFKVVNYVILSTSRNSD